ncbi:MAG: thiamine pyrophosphate-binding protein [Clostridia bacterium]|nr:thiamine pyrophosphate-binding protein [Clostridia bacterium]
MKGYKFIADTMKQYGVTSFFYMESMLENVICELKKQGVKAVLAHSENAAGYMADGYARASQRPGVCAAQSIGTANLAAGIHDASLANSPVIAITGKKPGILQYTGAYQEAEHRLFFEGITKFNADMTDLKQTPYILRRLFKDAVTGRPGPVHLDLPNNCGVTAEFADIDEDVFVQDEYKSYPAFRPAVTDGEKLTDAVRAISEAKKPVLIAGRGAIISDAGKELYALAQKSDIPIVTTPDGKTIIDEKNPLWAGVVGGYGMVCGNITAYNADLAIFVGTQANDQTTNGWTMPPRGIKAIQIDIDPRELGMKYPDTIGLYGDAKVVLQQLLDSTEAVSRPDWRKEVEGYVEATLNEYQAMQLADRKVITPERLCMEISKALPENAALFADTGNSAIWSSIMIRMKDTQSYYRAAGTLGWAYPASLGGKCALPDRPVYCFCGDGAFYYHLPEMETAVRNGINTVTIINNNGGLVQVRELLDVVYKDEPIKSKEEGYRFSNIDLSKVAEAMGCWSKRVTDVNEILPAIKEAEASGRPAIVEVVTSDSYPPNPMFDGPRPLYGFADAGVK